MTTRTIESPLLPRWSANWMLLALLLSSIPYLVGILTAGKGMTFTGIVVNETDTNSYFADMQLGLSGNWLYVMPYSATASRPVPLFGIYILLGHLSRVLSLSVPFVFHLARLVFGVAFVFFSYRFFARYLESEGDRKWALALLLFTGGWGWLSLILKGPGVPPEWIPDLWIFDAVSFGSMLGFPHFLLNISLMLLIYLTGEDYIRQGNWKSGLISASAGIGIALIHAHQLAIVFAVLAGLALVEGWGSRRTLWQAALRSASVILPGTLATIFLTMVSQGDPLLSSGLNQGNMYSPPPPALFILYGPGLILAFIGLYYGIHAREKKYLLPGLWFFVVLVCMYIPVNFQRRFVEGWHVPVSLFAALGWRRQVAPWLERILTFRKVKWILGGLFASMALSQVFLLAISVSQGLNPDNRASFLTADEQRAAQYLHDHAVPDEVVLAGFADGTRLPALTAVRSFLGHWALTPYVQRRLEDVRLFYNENVSDSARISLLRNFGIDYVYYGSEERELGGFAPGRTDYLIPVYTSTTVQLYKVNLQSYP
jgi:hypothetical protein